MGLFNEVGRFFETRLEEFLRENPQLELQAIEEQLREQEQGAQRLNRDLEAQRSQLEQQIMDVAKDIQHWHQRAKQAEAGGRADLAAAARGREGLLLRQGNQLWGKMEGARKRLEQSQVLLRQVQQKREEVKAKMAELKAADSRKTVDDYASSWDQSVGDREFSAATDPLEAQFQRWEMDEQIRQMKNKMGRH